MISSKNFIQFASSTSVTIATNKFNSFPNRSSIFANKKSVLDVNHSSKEIKQLSAVGPLKAVAEEDKDLIGVEKSNGKLENKDISFGDVDIKGNSRYLNAAIVLSAGTFAITKLLTIDHDYWQGWTLYEVLRYAPEHNWVAYEEALKSNPVFSKMVISGIVYFLGDWIAQCYEGKPLFEFDSKRMFRSGFVGFLLHGSLSHYYYQLCDALFPFKDWWVVPVKVAFDQTIWAAIWNSIYYLLLGILRFEDPFSVYNELKATFWPMLTAGWKLWPFAHVITYGVIPVEQRLLWVDSVELIWVTILSGYSNEKSEVRISEASDETDDVTQLSSKSKKHSIEDVNSPD